MTFPFGNNDRDIIVKPDLFSARHCCKVANGYKIYQKYGSPVAGQIKERLKQNQFWGRIGLKEDDTRYCTVSYSVSRQPKYPHLDFPSILSDSFEYKELSNVAPVFDVQLLGCSPEYKHNKEYIVLVLGKNCWLLQRVRWSDFVASKNGNISLLTKTRVHHLYKWLDLLPEDLIRPFLYQLFNVLMDRKITLPLPPLP